LLALLVLSGCDIDGYPQDLAYPVRSDPLVSELPKEHQPARFDLPGQFPQVINELETVGGRTLDPLKLSTEQRQALGRALEEWFGTPAVPKVEIGSDLQTALKLDGDTLVLGSRLYRQHCLHCHGLTGDGRGPTAPWVNPHPRDYRQGKYKFTSSSQDYGAARKARREDLLRTMREGIEGTSMPSFRLLADDELEALASYVIHLSLRGEVEFNAIRGLLLGDLQEATKESLREFVDGFANYWAQAQSSLIKVDANPYTEVEQRKASAQRGMKLFLEPGEAGCVSCHADFGRRSPIKYDDWGTFVRPTDFTTGVYRGGRRPVDLFYRIHSGINGAGMTAFGKTLKSEAIWDLVNFLQVLPYPRMRQEYGLNIE
jgi:mono/diheme cytochrome c family protein